MFGRAGWISGKNSGSFRWSPSSGPSLKRSPLSGSTSKSLSQSSAKVKERFVVGKDGALVRVALDPIEVAPEPIPPPTVSPPASGSMYPIDEYDDEDDSFMPAVLPKSLVAGPIIAWRLWRVTDEGILRSLGRSRLWSPGAPMRGAPRSRNAAGVYAMKHRANLAIYDDADEEYQVFGQVALWGRVIEHDFGYRAEFAYPVAIDLRVESPMPGFPKSTTLSALAHKIRANYGCEVWE